MEFADSSRLNTEVSLTIDYATRDGILEALSASERTVSAFFESLTEDELILRIDNAWCAAEHLEHLNSAVAAVAKGFSVPRIVLRFRVGRGRHPGRSYEALVNDYRARLASGGRASGRFVTKGEVVYHAHHHVAGARSRIERLTGGMTR